MGQRIIVGTEGGGESRVEHAVFYCSCVDVAFGPVIYARTGEALAKAECLLDYVASVTGERDMRGFEESCISDLYSEFLSLWGEGDADKAALCECGHGPADHDWSHGPVGRRVCAAYVMCPTEDDPQNEERCDCTGGWKPKARVK